MKTANEIAPVWINGPQLRRRWNIGTSTQYDRLKRGVIPKPEYPFGSTRPYWRLKDIEAFESASHPKPAQEQMRALERLNIASEVAA